MRPGRLAGSLATAIPRPQSVRPALLALGYTEEQVKEIMRYILGSLSLADAPHLNHEALKDKGFTPEDIRKIESQLTQVFELSFAFNRWTLGEDALRRLGFTPEQYDDPEFNMLRALSFTQKEIESANEHVCGRMTIEGAPYLREEHLPVFDCANTCGKTGKRYIEPEGHIRMMAATQPFISGAISKTINLPNDATVEDIKNCYLLSWKLGLKANALYRDGCKLSQPLSTKSDSKESSESKKEVKVEIKERIVIKEVPRRRKLPDERHSVTHKFTVAGHEGYIHVGMYEDSAPGEIFIKMSKEGTTLSGVMDALALSLSMNLQYGVPLEVLCQKLVGARFEPMGVTTNKEIPRATSMMDYLGRWLALKFLTKEKAKYFHNAELVEMAYSTGTKSRDAFAMRLPVLDEGAQVPMDMAKIVSDETTHALEKAVENATTAPDKIEVARQQGYTGSMCSGCGSFKVKRNGSCEACLDCGATSGCS